MGHLKFYRSLISISIALSLAGCTGNTGTATSTFTAVPPTRLVIRPSATPPLTADVGDPGLDDSLYPYFGNGGYDVQHYTLDLTVNDVQTSDLSGSAMIEAKATQNLSSFNLDFNGFEITGITVNGQAADFKRFRQELTITPSQALVENQAFTVEVQYRGSPKELRSAAIPMRVGWIPYEGGSYVMGEPDGAVTFFPANDHPRDKATYTFRVTVPKPFEVAANGILTATIDNGRSNTFVFEMSDPMASYLATVNIGEFDLETSQADNGIPIRNYFSTGVAAELRAPFALQDEMLVYFSELFGPYPFDVYGVLVFDFEIDGALENQTLSIFGVSDEHQPEYLESGIAHELAHQWFGDSVSLADWRDIWLNESFATYAQGLWIEHTQGREALDDWVRQTYAWVLENRQYASPPGEPVANNLFNLGVYQWGALGLHALRLEVGDEKFFEILRAYYNRFAGGNATTTGFIAVAEEVSGRELDTFFDRWLYSTDLAPIPAMDLGATP